MNYKVLKLHKKIDNRLCADCQLPLGDAANLYASLTFQVWICGLCAEVHNAYLHNIDSKVKNVNDDWSEDEVMRMEKGKSNVSINRVLERFIPKDWKRLDSSSSMVERKTWIRAKYYSMYFALPQGHDAPAVSNTTASPLSSKRERKIISDNSLPIRTLDFFMTIGMGKSLRSGDNTRNSRVMMESMQFQPVITSCFPREDRYPDTPIPDLVGPIVFPNGLYLSGLEKAPFCFSFVMTNVNRVKLYGTTLIVYELVDPEHLKTLMSAADHAALLHSAKADNGHRPQAFYAPKALTVISHYGFYHLFSKFLEQIYHLSLSAAPLPLERYISNFVLELPLPPQGRTEVFVSLPECMLQVSRPPRNCLPMVDFSYRPLFVCLGVENILSVFSCLCAEMTVCICSSNIALLTPVQEALLSLLFPFVWQGCYVPVLPASMMELLDAPVPLLVGIHDSYLFNTPEKHRPSGVVFVHLDTDTIIHNKGDADFFGEREILPLPKATAPKLRKKLIEHGECIYRNPAELQRLKRAGYPFPNNEHLVPIACLQAGDQGVTTQHQRSMSTSEMMSSLNKLGIKRVPGTGYDGSGGGGVPYRHPAACTLDNGTAQYYQNSNGTSSIRGDAGSILDPSNNCEEGGDNGNAAQFNAKEIRDAFLRFFVASLIDYHDHFSLADSSEPKEALPRKGLLFKRRDSAQSRFGAEDRLKFDKDGYAASLSDPFLKQLIHTQMFSNYISERLDCPDQAEIRFFDENILAKANRSKLALKKNSTPFLSDETDYIREAFTVPGPSTAGVSPDQVFSYAQFPVLSESLVGAVRPPKLLVREPEIKRVQGQSEQMIKQQLLKKAGKSALSPGSQGRAGRSSRVSRVSSEVSLDDSVHSVSELGRFLMGSSIGVVGSTPTIAEQDEGDDPHAETDDLDHALEEVLEEAHNRYLTVLRAVCTIQSLIRMRPLRRKYRRVLRALSNIKRFMRATSLRRTVSRRISARALVVLQKYWRMACARRRFKRCLRMIVALQSMFRGRKMKDRYLRVRRRLVKLQSLFHGRAARRAVKARLTAFLPAYRQQLLCLWELESTSLSYRSSFWSTFTTPNLLTLSLLQDELLRLYSSLGMYLRGSVYFAIKSEDAPFVAKFEQVEASAVVGKLKLLSSSGNAQGMAQMMKERSVSLAQATQPAAKEVSSRLSDLSSHLAEERRQLYLALKENEGKRSVGGPPLKDSLFRLYALPDTKKRKQRLVDSVWTSCAEGHADLSAQVVTQILQATGPDNQRLLDWAQCKRRERLAADCAATAGALLTAMRRNAAAKV